MSGQPPSPALSAVEGAVRQAQLGCPSCTFVPFVPFVVSAFQPG